MPLDPFWPATAFEIAAEAIARGAKLEVTPDRRLSVVAPESVKELRPLMKDLRDEIIALLEARSRPLSLEALSGPYSGFLVATNRLGPDPVRAGACLRSARERRTLR